MQECHALTCFSVIYSLTSSPVAYVLKSALPLPKKKEKKITFNFLIAKFELVFNICSGILLDLALSK